MKERAEVDEDPEWLDVEQGLGISVLKTLAARWDRQAVFANKHQGSEETEIEDGKAMLVNDDMSGKKPTQKHRLRNLEAAKLAADKGNSRG